MLGKVKYYKTEKKVAPETVAAFMLSAPGNYGNHPEVAALAALDHASDYAADTEEHRHWMEVHEVIRFWSFDSVLKGKGN